MEDKNKSPAVFDLAIGDLLKKVQTPTEFVDILIGRKAIKFLDTVLKQNRKREVDFLFELENNTIAHIEIQTYNDKYMPYRMLEYFTLIADIYKDTPIIQKVLYVGDKDMKMDNTIDLPNLKYSYDLIDARDIPCERLIKSDVPSDVVLAVLCNIKDPNNYAKTAVDKIFKLPENQRKNYISLLLTLSDLRPIIKEKIINVAKEVNMPITLTEELIKKNPAYKMGLEEGIQKGKEEGILEGMLKGKEEGIQEGIQKGKQEGKQEGMIEAKRLTIINLRKTMKLAPEDIANIVELSVDMVKDTLRDEGLL